MSENENDGRLNNIVDTMDKYGKKLIKLSKEIEKIAKKDDNEHIGKVSDIIKLLVGVMDNPYDLDDFYFYIKIFAGKQLLNRIDEDTKKGIRQNLIDYHYDDDEDEN